MLTVLMVVLWLSGDHSTVYAAIVPAGADCPDVAAAYMALKVTGNPYIMSASWSCFDVPKSPEHGA